MAADRLLSMVSQRLEHSLRWDTSQQQVLQLVQSWEQSPTQGPAHGPVLVYGAPGTGKTSLTVQLAVDFIAAGNDASRLLLLSPSRTAAADLRTRVEQELAASQSEHAQFTAQPSRSFAALAFWVLGQAREFGVVGAPEAPRLLSGAEQDAIIGELLPRFAEAAEDETSPWHRLAGAFEAQRSLRKQVRDFFDRCREHRVSAEELIQHSPQGVLGGVNRPEWPALGELYAAYQDHMSQYMPGVFDSSALVAEAERMLAKPTEAGEGPALAEVIAQRLDLILIDDLQEATPGLFRLIRALGAGRAVIAFANPDVAVQGFRGARPDKLANWTKPVRESLSPDAVGSMDLELPAQLAHLKPQVKHLSTGYRLSGEAAELYTQAVSNVGAVAALLRRRAGNEEPAEEMQEPSTGQSSTAEEGTQNTEVTSQVLISHHLADQYILQQVLQARFDGVEFGDIAVVVRNTDRMRRLGRIFTAHSVPVQRSTNEIVLQQEDSVWPLLAVMEIAAEQTTDLQRTLNLLGSVYTQADARQIRNIRQALLRRYRAAPELELTETLVAEETAEPLSLSDQLLVHATALAPEVDPLLAESTDYPEEEAVLQPLYKLRHMVAASRAAGEDPARSSAESVLWAGWDAAGVAEDWQNAALESGAGADRAHRNLDAVLGLFQAARRFIGEENGQDAAAFVDYVEELDLPVDGLVDTGTAEAGVEILTPATVAGREFHTVILSDLQDGEWPMVRPQGELLGAADLVAVVEAAGSLPLVDLMSKRQSSLMDEYRVFASAASRARNRLVLVAVKGDGAVPSSLFGLHQRNSHAGKESTATKEAETVAARPVAQIPRLMEGSALAAELRWHMEQQLRSATPDQQVVQAAAEALARLADAGVTTAKPEHWWGAAELSTAEPLLSADEPLYISPSAVATAQEQPLQWFTSQTGGERPRPFTTELGTFIHDEIHEPYPEAEEKVLLAVLEEKWPEFVSSNSWDSEREKAQAVELVKVLGRYYQSLAAQGRRRWVEELHLSREFQLDLAEELPAASPVPAQRVAVVSGMTDRIEISTGQDSAQGLYVVDLKTTKNPPKDEEVWGEYPQIGVYQLMIVSGAVPEAVERHNLRINKRLESEKLTAEQRQKLTGELIELPRINGETLDLAACAGAALLQLRRTSTRGNAKDPFQPQKPLAPQDEEPSAQWWEDSWPMQHLKRAAARMLHPQYRAEHAPNTGGAGGACYIGALCPLCETTMPVTQRHWGV